MIEADNGQFYLLVHDKCESKDTFLFANMNQFLLVLHIASTCNYHLYTPLQV